MMFMKAWTLLLSIFKRDTCTNCGRKFFFRSKFIPPCSGTCSLTCYGEWYDGWRVISVGTTVDKMEQTVL
jgi:endogenous inhibitor of DNA gyrase (YacG/DUF329 family)